MERLRCQSRRREHKYQTFYYAWGLFPMTRSDRPQYIIEEEHLVEARIVQGGLTEGIIAGFFGAILLGGFILPQNLTINGNRVPMLEGEAAR